MNNLLKNICLIIFALFGPVTLPAGGIQKNLNPDKDLKNNKEITLGSETPLYSFPDIDAKKLMVLDSGTSITILRDWNVNERDSWIRVELATNRVLEDPNKITKGWIQM